MPNAVYSHTFLVGCLNIPANYDLSSKVEGKWQRIKINQEDYPEYYKSHLNAMTDSESTSPFIDGIKQYQRKKGKACAPPANGFRSSLRRASGISAGLR